MPSLSSSPLIRSVPHSRLSRDISDDQVAYLGTEMRTSTSGAGLPTPEEAPALAMPAHHRFGYDEGQMFAPASAALASQNPQQLVREAKPSMRSASSRTGEHSELMAQEQVLEHQISV
jgi:hypothetical protein